MSEVLEDCEKHGPVYAAIAHVWGVRCPDFESDCWTCKAWAEYDALRQARKDALEEAAKICDVNAEKEYPLGEGFRNLDAFEIAAAIRSLKDRA